MDAHHEPELTPARHGLHLLLPDHHRRLEAKCHELLAVAFSEDPRTLVTRWSELEAELVDHIDAEEEVLLPAYAVHEPTDAKWILDEHARIRELLTPVGVDVELHEMRVARLQSLVEALEAHAKHEDAGMYPWAQQNLSEVAERLLFARIGRWFIGT